jgi:hypothetical protein
VKAELVDESETPGESVDAGAKVAPESVSVTVAAFENSHVAERMVASFGHDLRHKARKGAVNAFVVRRNRDGSFKLVQSRVLTAGGLGAAAIGFTAATMAGLMGTMSAFRGAKTVTHSARERQSHVRQPDQRLTEVFDQEGERSAVLLMLCKDEETGQAVASRAADRGTQSWHGSREEFLAALDRLGDNYDWVRPLVAQTVTQPPRGD